MFFSIDDIEFACFKLNEVLCFANLVFIARIGFVFIYVF